MSINLKKYERNLNQNWTKFIENPKENSWILFCFQGQTQDLNFYSTGDDGLDEFISELSDAQIMYGAIVLKDLRTDTLKIVFIFWLGSSLQFNVVSKSQPWINTVRNFFTGIEVEVHARHEDDLTQEAINKIILSAKDTSYGGVRKLSTGLQAKKEETNVQKPENTLTTRFEPKKPEPAKIEEKKTTVFQQKAEPKKPEPIKTEPKKIVMPQPKVEPKKPEPIKIEEKKNFVPQSKVEPKKPEPIKPVENIHPIPNKIEPKTSESPEKSGTQISPPKSENKISDNPFMKKQMQQAKEPEIKPISKFQKPAPKTSVQPQENKSEAVDFSHARFKFQQNQPAQPTQPTPQKLDQNKFAALQKNLAPRTENSSKPQDQSLPKAQVSVQKSHQPEVKKEPITQKSTSPPEVSKLNKTAFEKNIQKEEKPVTKNVQNIAKKIQIPGFLQNNEPTKAEVPVHKAPIQKFEKEITKVTPLKKEIKPLLNISLKALYNFEAEHENELSITEGEILTAIIQDDPDWSLVENFAGKRGLVPNDYVTEMKGTVENKKSPPHVSSNLSSNADFDAIAEFSFNAEDSSELSIKSGEELKVLKKTNADWWNVKNSHGKSGNVPASYLKMKNQDSKSKQHAPEVQKVEPKTEIKENIPKKSGFVSFKVMAEFDYKACQNDELSFQENDILTVTDKESDEWWKATNSHGKTGLIPSNYVKPYDEKAPPVSIIPQHEDPNTYVAEYDYSASLEDELSFNSGDILTVIDKGSDEWWTARNASGKEGLIPSNYVVKARPSHSKSVSPNVSAKKYMALYTYQAMTDTQLSVRENEILDLVAEPKDGWCEVRNKKNQQGLVPLTYLQKY